MGRGWGSSDEPRDAARWTADLQGRGHLIDHGEKSDLLWWVTEEGIEDGPSLEAGSREGSCYH